MPRFVLLRHECPPEFEKPSHWDFMLEVDGELHTWDLRELPKQWAQHFGATSTADHVIALPLPNHRREYLDFEGPISGNRGSVQCCDRGTYEVLQERIGFLKISIAGAYLQGNACLTQDGKKWLFNVNSGVS